MPFCRVEISVSMRMLIAWTEYGIMGQKQTNPTKINGNINDS
jgi:hypothetical protein